MVSLTGIGDVEEECHGHHCGKKGGWCQHGLPWVPEGWDFQARVERTIGEAEGYQEQREGRHPQARVQCSKGR